MRVQLARCRDTPFEFGFELDLSATDFRYHEFARPPRPHAEGRLRRGGGGKFVAVGKVDAEVEAVCVRCLAVFKTRLERAFQITFVPATSPAKLDQLDEVAYQGEEIDLKPAIEEQFHLSIPMRFLCSKDCRGLCPRCGASRNETTCTCGDEVVDPRFEVLRSLIQ